MTAKTGYKFSTIGPNGGAEGTGMPLVDENLERAGETHKAGAAVDIDPSTGYLYEVGVQVTSIAVTAAGTGYTSDPTVVITPTGFVSSVAMTAGGTLYLKVPAITFTGGAGSGAAATATINHLGQVDSITMTAGGTGYTSAPTVVITPAAGDTGVSAAATATVTGLTASGATAVAVRSGTTVASVTVTAAGKGYVTAPLITFTGGAGSGAAATASTAITTFVGFALEDGHNTATNGEKVCKYHPVLGGPRDEFSGTYIVAALAQSDFFTQAMILRDALTGQHYLDPAGAIDHVQMRGFDSEWVIGDINPRGNFTVKQSFIRGL